MNIRSSRMYTAPIPKMPPGLIELMEGLAKDVLKNTPENVYDFCAQHMQKLIEIRDGKAQKKEFTLDEKIARAIEKVKLRAEKRRKMYDSEMEILKTHKDNKTRNKRDINDKHYFIDHTKKEAAKIEETYNDVQLEHEKVESIEHTVIENKTSEPDLSKIILPENINIKIEKETIPVHDQSLDKSSSDMFQLNDDTILLQLNDEHIIEENKSELIVSIDDIENTVSSTIQIIDNTPESTNTITDTYLQGPTNELNDTTPVQFDTETEPEKFTNTDFIDISKIADENYSNNIKDENVEEVELNQLHDVEISENVVIETAKDDICNQETTVPLFDEFNTLYSKETSEIKDNSNNKPSGVDAELLNGFENSMDLEKAAITIQKVFRAFLFKSKTLSVDEVTNVDFNFFIENADKEGKVNDMNVENLNIERRPIGISKMDTVLQTVNEEKSLSLSTEDSSTLSSAATIIQAHVRGFLVRSKMPLNQTISTTSIIDSDVQSATSLDGDQNLHKNKTVLNIHIVPDGSDFISRDESLITSVDLSLDGSPHYSTNLHSLGYDISERRKQLKREDAVQSVSPPSNNSGKLSEDVDSVKEIILNGNNDDGDTKQVQAEKFNDFKNGDDPSSDESSLKNLENASNKLKETREMTSDEADVVTPFIIDGLEAPNSQNNTSKLMHSGEFHDIVLPTIISRNNTSVVRGE